MPIPFVCPHCGLQTRVADQYAGLSGPCLGCGKTVTVPMVAPGSRAAAQGSGVGVVVIVLIAVAALVGLLVCGGIALMLPMGRTGGAREAARRSQCTNNLKQIALALHNYHDVYKCFPPAVTTDKQGRPMHSWRVAILPFLEQKALYDRYNFNEPWDGPNNSVLANTAISVYHCPSDPDPSGTETSYVMIVGAGTIGGLPNEKVGFKDVTDGTSSTILVAEVVGAGIDWMEPRDLSIDEMSWALNDGSGKSISSNHPGGAMIALADGSVRFLANGIDPGTLRRLILRNDGQPAPQF